MVLPYHAVPERLLDDPEAFAAWARRAEAAALAAKSAGGKKRRPRKGHK